VWQIDCLDFETVSWNDREMKRGRGKCTLICYDISATGHYSSEILVTLAWLAVFFFLLAKVRQPIS
jgi:hypothetical protein